MTSPELSHSDQNSNNSHPSTPKKSKWQQLLRGASPTNQFARRYWIALLIIASLFYINYSLLMNSLGKQTDFVSQVNILEKQNSLGQEISSRLLLLKECESPKYCQRQLDYLEKRVAKLEEYQVYLDRGHGKILSGSQNMKIVDSLIVKNQQEYLPALKSEIEKLIQIRRSNKDLIRETDFHLITQKFFRLRRSKIQVYEQKFAQNINQILHYYNVSLKAYIRKIKFYQRLVLAVAFIILGIEALLMFPNIFQKLKQYTLNLEQAHQLTQEKNKELSQAYDQLKVAESKTRDQANHLRESNVNLMKTQHKLKQTYQELQQKNEELEKTHNVWDMNRQLEAARFFDASVSHFSEVMRWKTNQNIYTWSENLLGEIVPYVRGIQATLYAYDDEKQLLFLTGSYAVEQDKIIDNTEVGLGEGLIGQVAKSQNPIYLNLSKSSIPLKAPQGTLGTQVIEPKAIYVLPCNYNENIAGVMEMTLSQALEEKHLQLLERLGEGIGAHLNALQDQRRINQLFAESKMAQKNLRRSIKKIADNEERFRKLSEVTQEGILFLNDNIIKDANMVLVRMMGYESIQELHGKHYITLIAPKYRFEIAERKMLSDGQEHETIACKKNNETFPVEIQSRNVKYQDEWMTVISIRDITEKKRTQKQLEEANRIASLVTELEKKNKDITSSIEYAQRIQEAILPGDKLIGKGFVEHFVLYIPKDIVSGDFYWFADKNEHALIAAVDCTGHGVPGAFMSIIGYSNLNKIVIEQGLTDPASILKKLDQEVTEVLKQQETDSRSRDGMDLALCSLNIYEKKLKFAGAYRPLYLIREGELQEYKGSPFPIGGNFKYKRKKVFKSHEVHLHKGDSLYIFSDGFVDQFGGPENRKYMTKKFKKLLLSLQHYDMKEQKQILYQEFLDWKQEYKQMDDILVMGMRF